MLTGLRTVGDTRVVRGWLPTRSLPVFCTQYWPSLPSIMNCQSARELEVQIMGWWLGEISQQDELVFSSIRGSCSVFAFHSMGEGGCTVRNRTSMQQPHGSGECPSVSRALLCCWRECGRVLTRRAGVNWNCGQHVPVGSIQLHPNITKNNASFTRVGINA